MPLRSKLDTRTQQVRNPSDTRRVSHQHNAERHVGPEFSEPRSGGPVDRALTGVAHENRHPNAAQLERGASLASGGTTEPLNEDKFNNPNRMVVIIPPAGFERLPGEPDGMINEISETHGYDPSTIAYAAGPLAEAQNRYVQHLPTRQRAVGVVGDYPQEWGQPRMIVGREESNEAFIDRGDLSVDTGKEKLKSLTNWIPGTKQPDL